MCLVINKKLCPNGYKTARKNIPCYKVLLKTCDGKFKTLYRRELVDITIGIIADRFQTKPINDCRIDKGIHSFTNLETAIIAKQLNAMALVNLDPIYIDAIVLKAYIPKGAKYWVGEQYEFCSEKIVFAKK